MANAWLHVVLIEPEIPQNTGNIGRTCVGLGATLHFVGKLGFSITGKELRRAGLDYWPKLKTIHHKNWPDFQSSLPQEADVHFFSTKGRVSLWERRFQSPTYLVFGNESRGLPPSFYHTYEDSLVRIPMEPGVRSLNLSVSVGVAAFEAARQITLTITH